MKKTVALIASVSMLLFALGSAVPSIAQDEWETWPPKKGAPPPTEEEAAAAAAGEEAGKRTEKGISRGTLGWAAAIVGGVAVIGIAAGGGGGGTSTPPTH